MGRTVHHVASTIEAGGAAPSTPSSPGVVRLRCGSGELHQAAAAAEAAVKSPHLFGYCEHIAQGPAPGPKRRDIIG